jgi:hypothetical protein
MPKPNPNESKKDFIARCVPYVMKNENVKDSKYAVAKCNGIWEQHKKKQKSTVNVFEFILKE